jgi:hypothetical protein
LAVLLPLFVESQRTALALFGFEVVVAVASALGVLLGLGRLRQSPGMALACIAGTILMGSAFGWQGAGFMLADVSLTPLLGLRAAASLVLGCAAAVVVLIRDRASVRSAIVGGLLGMPVLLALAGAVHPSGRRMLDSLMSEGGAFQTLIAGTVLLVLGGLLAASVHMIMGAFDRALGEG